jgi:hypothetical protein
VKRTTPFLRSLTIINGKIRFLNYPYCEDCIKAIEEEREKNNSEDELKYCDHCKGMVKGVRPMRDPEEGSCGRLYYLCEQHRSVLLSSFVDDDDCSPQHYGYDD